jgi:hypothetical protein
VVIGWCHLTTFTARTSMFLVQWYLLCLTIDSYITCCIPDREHSWCSTWRAVLVTIVIGLLGLVVFLNISLTVSVFYVSTRPICTTLPRFTSVIMHLDRVDVMLNVFVPLATILLMGLRMVVREIRNIGTLSPIQQNSYVMFVLVHGFLWMPLQFSRVYNAIYNMAVGEVRMSLRAYLWEQIFMYAGYTNMALSIVLLIAFQSGFRRHLHKQLTYIFCCMFIRCRIRQSNHNGIVLNHHQDSEYSTSITVQTAFIENSTPSDEDI